MEGLTGPDVGPAPILFNSTIETGIRAVIVLNALYPRACGLAEVTCFDHVVVHSGDLDDGPESLHPALPPRAGELVVRRGLIGESLRLMCQMHLVDERHDEDGIRFVASDDAPSFLRLMQAPYSQSLKQRADWIADRFRTMTEGEVETFVTGLVDRWRRDAGPDDVFGGGGTSVTDA